MHFLMEISFCYLNAFLIISQKENSCLLSKKYFNFLLNDKLDKSSSYFTESKELEKKKTTQALEFIIFSISRKSDQKYLNQVLSYSIDYTVQFFLEASCLWS